MWLELQLRVEQENPHLQRPFVIVVISKVMANLQLLQEIIDISSTDSEVTISTPLIIVNTTTPPNESSPSVNWNGIHETNIEIFANNVLTICHEIIEQVREMILDAYLVQEFEIQVMQEIINQFHVTCERLAAFCNILRELSYDEYYGVGNDSSIKRAFHNIVNDM